MIARIASCPFLVRRDGTREVNTDDHKRTHDPAVLSRDLPVENYYSNEQRENQWYSISYDYSPSRSRMRSATSRRSAPTTSGPSTSGSSTIPGRATNAAAQPARRAPAISQAWAAISLRSPMATPRRSATIRYGSGAGFKRWTASAEKIRSKYPLRPALAI